MSFKDAGLVWKKRAESLRGLPARLDLIGRAMLPLYQQAATRAPINTGAYRMGWGYEVKGTSLLIFNTTPAGSVIEEGRRPGSATPPPGAMRAWVEAKTGLSGQQASRAAYLISRAVARRGLPAYYIARDMLPVLKAKVGAAVRQMMSKP